jgi:hypothetical protein
MKQKNPALFVFQPYSSKALNVFILAGLLTYSCAKRLPGFPVA